MVNEALEMGVGDGYPPEFYNLGVCQGASLLAALTRLIITDTETSTYKEKKNKHKNTQLLVQWIKGQVTLSQHMFISIILVKNI